MATLGEQILQFGAGVFDYVDKRNDAKKDAKNARDVAIIRAQADAARADAEASAQAAALNTQVGMQADMQKWLTWAIVGVVVVAVMAIGGGLIAKMFRKRG